MPSCMSALKWTVRNNEFNLKIKESGKWKEKMCFGLTKMKLNFDLSFKQIAATV